ncbi:hypothetical protein [Nocardia sp. NPDC051570]|uniref:hypothetical protein n=1 Tax=Nocardia sp. NPDC051570 TaxID=3364324 RepID=UPI00379432F0
MTARRVILHITSTEDGEATWQIVGRKVQMESFTDYRSQATAYRLRMDGSTVDIPNGTPGMVFFGEDEERPDLPLVREWVPKHFGLWDAVQAAYWDAVNPLDEPRISSLDHLAYDYSTGAWQASEIREMPATAGPSARRGGER